MGNNAIGSVVGVLLCAALAGGACAKDVTVDSGGGGDFTTVQAAVDAVAGGNSQAVRILIKPGKYEEKIAVPANKPFIQFLGQGSSAEQTVLTFHLKASDPKPGGSGNVGTTGSSSVTITGSDFLADNITFANSAGDKVGQAVALKTNGDRLIFHNCQFLGFQDTLYPSGEGRVYFSDCYITGNTDFIFGNAIAVFDRCTINSSDSGFDTAANTMAKDPLGFVMLDCTLTCSEGVKAGSVFLGRPWQWDRGPKASVTYVRTKMGPHISPTGWHPWDAKNNTDPGKTARFSEFASTDLDGNPLDVSKRVAWSHQLSEAEAAELTVEKILGGNDQWNPEKILHQAPSTKPE